MRRKKRYKMNYKKSKKLFHRTAKKSNRRNYTRKPMRGGIRL
jgi:hypothetical protein